MTSDTPFDRSTADVHLEFDSNKVGFRLAKLENGKIGWRPGWAPMLAPQVRQDSLSYTHLPPDVDLAVAFEDWQGGCGHAEAPLFDVTPNVYSHTRHIDLSWPQHGYKSPARQDMPESDGTAINAAPVKFWDGSDGFFVIAGQYIYEWDVSAQEWVERDDATGDGEDYVDIVEMNGTLSVSRGASADYKTSTDGVTWTAFTAEATGDNPEFFAVRGISSKLPVLWQVDANVEVLNSTDPTSSGWSNSDALAHTSETVQGMVVANDDIYVMTDVAFYRYTGTTQEDVWTGGRQMKRANNGEQPFVWIDGRIYVSYGDRLLAYEPFGDSDAAVSIQAVFPTSAMLGNAEVNGQITAKAGDADALYLALKNSAGKTYIIKGDPHRGVWHTLAYLGANDCNTMIVVGPGTVHATNPVLVIGYGTGARFLIQARSGLRPEDDTEYRFETTQGVAVGPWVGVGTKQFPKLLNAGRVHAENATAGMPITLNYEIDADGTETEIVVAKGERVTSANTTSEVQFNRIRYIANMDTAADTMSPRLQALMFNCVVQPPRKRMWSMDLELGDAMQQVGGETLYWSRSEQESFLFQTDQQRVTLYDRDNRTFIVRVQGIGTAEGIRPLAEGDNEVYTVLLTEISETTELTFTFTLNEDALGSTKVLA